MFGHLQSQSSRRNAQFRGGFACDIGSNFRISSAKPPHHALDSYRCVSHSERQREYRPDIPFRRGTVCQEPTSNRLRVLEDFGNRQHWRSAVKWQRRYHLLTRQMRQGLRFRNDDRLVNRNITVRSPNNCRPIRPLPVPLQLRSPQAHILHREIEVNRGPRSFAQFERRSERKKRELSSEVIG